MKGGVTGERKDKYKNEKEIGRVRALKKTCGRRQSMFVMCVFKDFIIIKKRIYE